MKQKILTFISFLVILKSKIKILTVGATMGRGDKKTRKGKIFAKSAGNSRLSNRRVNAKRKAALMARGEEK